MQTDNSHYRACLYIAAYILCKDDASESKGIKFA